MGIKAEEIPEVVLQATAQKAYASILDFFDDPENERKFQEWKKARQEAAK